MKRVRSRRNGTSGFTLFEIIIAVGLSAVFLSLAYAMIFTAHQRWRAQKDNSQGVRSARSAFESLERDLERAVPFGRDSFLGEPHEMAFLSVLNERVGKVRYRWEKSGQGAPSLVREWRSFSAEGALGHPRSEYFSPGLLNATFSYAHINEVSGRTLWLDRWTHPSLPRGIRIRLELAALPGGPLPDPPALVKTVQVLHGVLGKVR